MVWEMDARNAGFSDATPWLPVKAPQAARAVDAQNDATDSVLAFYRNMIAFRKSQTALKEGKTTFYGLPAPLLAFVREAGQQTLSCVFNLSHQAQALRVDGRAGLAGPRLATLTDAQLVLPPNGFAFLAHETELTLSISD